MHTYVYFLFAGAVVYVIRCAFKYGHRTSHMAPGPPTLPFIGNIHQIPTSYTHMKHVIPKTLFTEWAKRYGGIYSLKLGHQTMVVVPDRKLVKQYVDKKSTIYSHRPPSYVSHDLITRGNHLLVMHYGDQWRTFRKLINQHFMEAMCEREHLSVQNAEAVNLVKDFLVSPEDHMIHPKRFSNSVTNSIESLFSNWISRARAIGGSMESLYDDILKKVIERRESGKSAGSFMDRVLDQQESEKIKLTNHQLSFLGGVLMEGGSDTSSALILAVVQALIKYLGNGRGKITSVVRFRQTTIHQQDRQGGSPLEAHSSPLFPSRGWRRYASFQSNPLRRQLTALLDDWIDGHFVPKGSTVMLNVWGMHMDENVWEKPEDFIPERYDQHPSLAPVYVASGEWEKRDHYGYGAGRRVCPGIHLAERNMFLSVAKLLWAFRFEEEMGADGKPLVNDPAPDTGYHQGFLYCAKDYGCKTTPRSDKIKETIMREYSEAEESVFSRFIEV
ncbi:MAG: hypothetical protein M1837_001034 [Sclerophora amabilis]|nr:MAG: hypothetical protein M1837_001034 [Sclerophora amabilis]